MNYAIIDNFLNKEKCKKLINFSDNLLNSNEAISYHGNRSEIFSTYSLFQNMIANQIETKNFNDYLFSKEFFDLVCEKLSIETSDFKLIKYYNTQKFDILNKNRKNVSLIPDNQLIKIFFTRKIRQLKAKTIFNNFFSKKKKLELLYGLSKAGNNYKQAIHRDSDSRLVVFLIYLNDTNENATGGNLDLYKKIGKINDIENPNINSLEKVISIKPKEGRLVVFKNEDNAFHGVEVMKNFKDYRYFIYGSFTLLNDKSPYISNKKIPTEFFLY
jgi:Rps23 Pro-64 3,4-dihydroxylase Tpa1-like proline 4-hydroxylase